jgi:hypothetical protein
LDVSEEGWLEIVAVEGKSVRELRQSVESEIAWSEESTSEQSAEAEPVKTEPMKRVNCGGVLNVRLTVASGSRHKRGALTRSVSETGASYTIQTPFSSSKSL